MKIGTRLRDVRRSLGLTQDQVIEGLTRLRGEAPFNRQSLSHYETDRCQPPYEVLALLCRFYNVSIGDILTLEDLSGESRQPVAA